jgi:beta-lactamase superfamily II metal-dependent hydrolase
MRIRRAALTVGCCAFACTGSTAGVDNDSEADTSAAKIRAHVASSVADVSGKAPARGHYRVHFIDVGSGLAVLVQGADFNLLFDGGSGDDSRGIVSGGNKSRLLAYLFAAIGPSGEAACTPEGDTWPDRQNGAQLTIDHLILSHPHDDHVSMLDAVLRCYQVKNVWEPGMGYDNQEYGQFLKAVADESATHYHTVVPVPRDRSQTVHHERITIPDGIPWTTFDEGQTQTLGSGTRFKILHVDGESHKDNANLNSISLRVELGRTSLLLLGDTMAGAPSQPLDADPSLAEGELMERHLADIDADILQVGHHGSSTSSRSAFIKAVTPAFAVISAGPRPYTGEVLPTGSVVRELSQLVPNVLRTDTHDKGGCPERDRIGVEDDAPGGCDNVIFEIGGR